MPVTENCQIVTKNVSYMDNQRLNTSLEELPSTASKDL
jgi:hypothetical protein